MCKAIFAQRSQQRNSVRWVGHVQIDASDIGQIAAVFMSLEDEMPPIIVARCRAAGIAVKDQIEVLVGRRLVRSTGSGTGRSFKNP